MTNSGERLDYARKQIGLTYKELGDIVGITESGIRLSIKRNTVKDHYINLISDKTGINKNWLLNGEGEMLLPKKDFKKKGSDLGVLELIKHLLDRNDELIQNETYRDYIRMTMELIMADDEREKKNKALEELRNIAIKKHQKD
ncbi:hypothetical protein [Aquimarina algiphila]|uniref:hypothetical protein n=1 Tax=Aquimarina algiphila TaxID=2047982 RepID=UPI00232CE00A|nr:hypothetical protein [Aquimarina algiphila]